MKILITTPYFHPQIGGLEHYASQVARGLVQRGHEVHVVTSGKNRERENWEGLTIHRLPSWFTLSNTPVSPLWPLQLRRLIRQIKPDVINTHAPVPSMALATAVAAGRTPLVVTYHAGSMKKGSPVLDAIIATYENLLLPWLLCRSSTIICASEFVRSGFLSNWAAKSTVITPGVDTTKFRPHPDRVQRGRVIFVGNFEDPRKGLTVLLSAIKQVPAATLRVVGPGPVTPQNHVEYTGPLTGDALVRELQSAHVLVLPSVTEAESFGMVLIEAMACGRPVIGSDIGGIPHVILPEKTGLIVPAGDAKALAAAIERVITNDQFTRQLGETARAHVEEEYTWTCRIDATEDSLRQTTEVRRG